MDLAKMTLDNFYTATESDKINLINANEKDVQCVVVNSIKGNGASHLMMGISKKIANGSLLVNYENLISNNGLDEINRLDLNYFKHLFLDSWNGFYLLSDMNGNYKTSLDMMEEKISSFIINGGKVYMTGTIDNMNERLLSFVSQFSSSFIQLDKVEKEILTLLLRDFDSEYKCDFEMKFGKELLDKSYYSYREFQNELIGIYAKQNLNKDV